ncbi:cob(I)yrinic acid a,c-diamide adenosyltransferase [Staphylococcus chromogenes]|nr:cob(I)yrinic acid a,c-diamide adenosyltransferase [Staphylococcus chromogenes]
MSVHLTKIYTRTGDDGTTGLSNFERVAKTDSRLVAYADTEEANAAIGAALALSDVRDDIARSLQRIQNELFDCGADLATPIEENPKYPPLRIEQSYIDRLEEECDRFNAELEALTSFILPGGTPAAALIHQARVITRRAERAAWAAHAEFPETTSALPAKYLNRLSDLLFIVGRIANAGNDILWVPGGQR